MNELVDIFKKIIKRFLKDDLGLVYSVNANMRIVTGITQFISIIFLRGDVYHELTDQLRKYVLQDLADLLIKLLVQRDDPFERILLSVIDHLTCRDEGFATLENSLSSLSWILVKIREMVDVEVKLSHAMSLFLKVSKSEFYLKVSGEHNSHSTEIKPPLFDSSLLELTGSLVNETMIKIDKYLSQIEDHFFKNVLNNVNEYSGMMVDEQISLEDVMLFFEEEQCKKKTKETFLTPNFDKGIEFDGKVIEIVNK